MTTQLIISPSPGGGGCFFFPASLQVSSLFYIIHRARMKLTVKHLAGNKLVLDVEPSLKVSKVAIGRGDMEWSGGL